jgi:hypothetical protein
VSAIPRRADAAPLALSPIRSSNPFEGITVIRVTFSSLTVFFVLGLSGTPIAFVFSRPKNLSNRGKMPHLSRTLLRDEI